MMDSADVLCSHPVKFSGLADKNCGFFLFLNFWLANKSNHIRLWILLIMMSVCLIIGKMSHTVYLMTFSELLESVLLIFSPIIIMKKTENFH